jgi:Flp pilus assembly protein TadG
VFAKHHDAGTRRACDAEHQVMNGERKGCIRTLRRLIRMTPLRRFTREEDGTSTIEFAMVITPFLALLFAIMETAVVFLADQTLETAVADSARLIMTGQAQKQKFDQQTFKNSLCSRIYALFDCQGGIMIDVRTAKSFGDANTGKPIDAKGNLVNNFTYDPGKAGDIVVVRVMYQWPVWVPGLGLNLADMANGKRLLMATSAFRNEPF